MSRNILYALLLLLITSCTVFKEYPIEVYSPGEIAVPPGVDNVAIVYRNFKYSGDTLQHYYKKDHRLIKAKNDPGDLDSLLAGQALKELASRFKSNNTFDRIHIFPEIFKPHSGNKMPRLNFATIKRIADLTETGLIISLETFTYFFSAYSSDYDTPESREVITAAVWAVYDPSKEKLIERKSMIDTLYWNGYDEKGNYNKNALLPPRLAALKVAAQMAGENYSKRFYASWKTVNRIYSVPPLPEFKEASLFMEKRKYDQAISLWKKYAVEKNGKMAINARYNIALAYELKDDMIMAMKWLNAAQELAIKLRSKQDIKLTLQYKRILSRRLKEIQMLEQN